MMHLNKIKSCIYAIIGSNILAFGLYQVHSFSGVTEGGMLGLNLFLDHWFQISPSITNFVGNVLCYLLGWKILGKEFLFYSFFAAAGFSISYGIFEQFEPFWPQLYDMPLLAAILGAMFVGIGTGICVKVNAAICGDDALAMCISHLFHIRVEWAYLASDLIVLGLSATYIPFHRLIYSLLTVILSGQIIGIVQRIHLKKKSV